MVVRTTRTRWRLAACPKCGGDLATEEYMDGSMEWDCLQCGWAEPVKVVRVDE